jgi:hypothetical protein
MINLPAIHRYRVTADSMRRIAPAHQVPPAADECLRWLLTWRLLAEGRGWPASK